MRALAFITGANPKRGGLGSVGVPGICKALADRGHHVELHVAGRIIPGAEPFVRRGADREGDTVASPETFQVFAHPAYGDWSFAPGLLREPYRRAREADVIMLYSLYSFPLLAGYLLARLNDKPYAIWPNGVLAPFQRSVSRRKKMVYDRIIARRILDEAAVIVYTAIGEREEARPLKLAAPSVVIPHGFDSGPYGRLPARDEFRDRYLNGHTGPLVLYLGRLHAKKGLDLLAASVARVADRMPDVRLAIVGSGDPPEFAGRVRGWLRDCQIEDRTVMTGVLIGSEKLAALAAADLFVQPSQAENFGYTVFEAMASRVPVVISDTLSYAAEVERCASGLVVQRDPERFAAAILELLGDRERGQRMAENAVQLVRSYSWQRNGEGVERTMQCVLRGIPLPADLTLCE